MASEVALRIDTAKVPRLQGALDAIAKGAVPAGLLANREYAECIVSMDGGHEIAEEIYTLMFDPQTSGGLLISVEEGLAPELLNALVESGLPAARIGRVVDGKPQIILQ